MSGDRHALPEPDRDSAPFWSAMAEGRLALQRCSACGTRSSLSKASMAIVRSASVKCIAMDARKR